MSQTLISVCLCTFRREHVFETLKSLAAQKLPKDMKLEAVVVNNDPKTDLESRINEHAAERGLVVKYGVEQEQNISRARNHTIELASGDWIAFIDDDETAEPDWVAELYKTAIAHNADAVMGPVKAVFPHAPPEWIVGVGLFDKSVPRTGTILDRGRTSNALVASRWFNEKGYSFDPDYGMTGAEDAHFFQRILLDGGKIVSCREAVIYELAETKRLNLDYLKSRAIQGGANHTRLLLPTMSMAEKIGHAGATVGKLLLFLTATAVALPFGKKTYVRHLLRAFKQLGKIKTLSSARKTEFYRTE